MTTTLTRSLWLAPISCPLASPRDRLIGDRPRGGVVCRASELERRPVLARWVDPIGEQDDEEVTFRVDPDTGAGESGMAEGTRREVVTRARSPSGCVPPECTAGATGPPGREASDRLGSEEAPALPRLGVVVESTATDHLGEDREVTGGGEEPCVASDTAYEIGSLIIDDRVQRRPPASSN